MGRRTGGPAGHLAAVLGFALLVLVAPPAQAECGMVGSLLNTCDDRDPRPPRPPKQSKAALAEERLLTFLNEDRRAAGVGPLRAAGGAARGLARAHAQRMMRRGKAFHNPDLGSSASRQRLGYPSGLGENVGFGPKVGGVHGAFMKSDGHRHNVLAPWYDAVGIGVAYDGRTYWVVEVFLGGIGHGPGSGAVSLPSGGRGKARPAARGAPSPVLPEDDDFPLGISAAADPVAASLPWGLMSVSVFGLAAPGLFRYARNRRRALRA